MHSLSSVTPNKAITVSLLAALLAAVVAAFFAFGTKPAKAQAEDVSIKVEPTTVDLGDVASGHTEETTIKIKNNGNVDATIGAIDLEILQGDLDPDDIELVGPNGVLNGVLDLVTGLLELDTPIELDPNETIELVLKTTPDGEGTLKLVIDFLNEALGDVLGTVTVTGTARDCTIPGTTGNDTLTDTPDDDIICGFEGNDTITAPNGGDDVVLGGPDNDTINIKDGVRKNDLANGGTGKDSCKKDRKDKKVKCGTTKKPK